MNKFVIGDIHGGYKALLQCLERSNFNKEEDLLIEIGDVADGWPEVPQCVEELMSIKNLIAIRGNHDEWCYEWLLYSMAPDIWLSQGGEATKKAYEKMRDKIDWDAHIKFFRAKCNYYIDDDNKAFVHAGYRSFNGLGEDNSTTYQWDRELFNIALSGRSNKLPHLLRPYKEIFIGHTSTTAWYSDCKPIRACNVFNIDTGAGWSGKLTIMNINTKKYWQSDKVVELYPNAKRRWGKR